MAFVHLHAPQAVPSPLDVCFVIQADRLLARAEVTERVTLPDFASVTKGVEPWRAPVQIGRLDGQSCWLIDTADVSVPAPSGWLWQDTRALLGVFTPAQSHAMSCARQIAWFARRNQFCGVCGTATVDVPIERAKRCPRCSAVHFPSASPAVIVAVTRGDELLLAHNRNFRPGLYSLLAGFLDPGETFEQAVVREVQEEVGVEIGELSYVASQPWSFPNSVMLGFRARYLTGELQVDGKEIETAGWFRANALPDVPREGTVARHLIDAWLRE